MHNQLSHTAEHFLPSLRTNFTSIRVIFLPFFTTKNTVMLLNCLKFLSFHCASFSLTPTRLFLLFTYPAVHDQVLDHLPIDKSNSQPSVLTQPDPFTAFDAIVGHQLITFSFLKHSTGILGTIHSWFSSCFAGCSAYLLYSLVSQLPDLYTSTCPRP